MGAWHAAMLRAPPPHQAGSIRADLSWRALTQPRPRRRAVAEQCGSARLWGRDRCRRRAQVRLEVRHRGPLSLAVCLEAHPLNEAAHAQLATWTPDADKAAIEVEGARIVRQLQARARRRARIPLPPSFQLCSVSVCVSVPVSTPPLCPPLHDQVLINGFNK